MVNVQLDGLDHTEKVPPKKSGVLKEGRTLTANIKEKTEIGPKLFVVPLDDKHGVIV